MKDYWGYGKAAKPMLPMIGIPTTAGTGSEAQSFALIADTQTHVKMACGDAKASFRVALLDPSLTLSQPLGVTATAGFDAISHAVETFVTIRGNPISDSFSREAWRLLEGNFERVLKDPKDLEGRSAMQLGAHYAGVAIENSMLGATHACANPLTAHYGTTHGLAIATLLASVVRWNAVTVASRYAEFTNFDGQHPPAHGSAETLAQRLEETGNQPQDYAHRLRDLGVPEEDLPMLAEEAAIQWTGKFNPRPLDRQVRWKSTAKHFDTNAKWKNGKRKRRGKSEGTSSLPSPDALFFQRFFSFSFLFPFPLCLPPRTTGRSSAAIRSLQASLCLLFRKH